MPAQMAPSFSATSLLGDDLLSAGTRRKTARTARVSSWDHSGLNEDAFIIQPGETALLADIEGPGKITHLWFVQACRRNLGPGLIPFTKGGAPIMEIGNGLGFNYEDNDPGKSFHTSLCSHHHPVHSEGAWT